MRRRTMYNWAGEDNNNNVIGKVYECERASKQWGNANGKMSA